MDNQQNNPYTSDQNNPSAVPGPPPNQSTPHPAITPSQSQPQYVQQPAPQQIPHYTPEAQAQPAPNPSPPAPAITAVNPVEYTVAPLLEETPGLQPQNEPMPKSWQEPVAQQPYSSVQQPVPSAPYAQQPMSQAVTQQQGASPIQKYKIFQAASDTLKAAKNNIVTLLVTGFIAYVVAIILFSVIILLMFTQFVGRLSPYSISGGAIIGGIVGGLVLYTIWYAVAYAFILSVTSLSIRDGAQKRKGKIGETLKRSLSLIKRVALANTLVALVLIWPIVIISFLPLLLLSTGSGRTGATILVPIVGIVAVIWAIIGSLRYALVPYVAIFEPDVPITKTLKISKNLLQKGGQWFILKGFLLILLIAIVLGVITGKNLQELNSTNNIGVNVILIIVSAIASGCMVMLYINRKAVKS